MRPIFTLFNRIAILGLALAAVFAHHTGALNVSRFLAGLSGLAAVCMILSKKVDTSSSWMPTWLIRVPLGLTIMTFAYGGYFGCCTAWCLVVLAIEVNRERLKKATPANLVKSP